MFSDAGPHGVIAGTGMRSFTQTQRLPLKHGERNDAPVRRQARIEPMRREDPAGKIRYPRPSHAASERRDSHPLRRGAFFITATMESTWLT